MTFFTSLIYEFFYSVTIMVVIKKMILCSLRPHMHLFYGPSLPLLLQMD